MKKQIIVLGLAVLGAIAVSNSANAQTAQPSFTSNATTFTVPGKNIHVAYTVPTGSAAKSATFTLTNKMGSALKKGESFTLELPAVPGFRYDLSKLESVTGLKAGPVTSQLIMTKDFADKAAMSFQFPLVPGEPTESNPVITFSKQ